ncbi:MAG TPA: acetate uptake transporter [Dehalococcoidia bacterium]|nr:acetate uptake transporter [Dehalococcoidia bacterium]
MKEQTQATGTPNPLAVLAFSLTLFVWSAFHAGYFDQATQESFIIPLAVFFAAPMAGAAAMWALYRGDSYLATAAGLFGAYWGSYGLLLWLTERGVVAASTSSGDIRGLLFATWAVAFAIVWLGSIRQHWAMSLIALGAAVMFVFLSIAGYRDSENALKIAGWVGFVTAGLGAYFALAELLNTEFERVMLPTDLRGFGRLGQNTR